jgi:hypothetical protein
MTATQRLARRVPGQWCRDRSGQITLAQGAQQLDPRRQQSPRYLIARETVGDVTEQDDVVELTAQQLRRVVAVMTRTDEREVPVEEPAVAVWFAGVRLVAIAPGHAAIMVPPAGRACVPLLGRPRTEAGRS